MVQKTDYERPMNDEFDEPTDEEPENDVADHLLDYEQDARRKREPLAAE